jgi:hypothetical protein
MSNLKLKLILLNRKILLIEDIISKSSFPDNYKVYNILKDSIKKIKPEMDYIIKLYKENPEFEEYVIDKISEIETTLRNIEFYWNHLESTKNLEKTQSIIMDKLIDNLNTIDVKHKTILSPSIEFSTMFPSQKLVEPIYLFCLPNFERKSLLNSPLFAHELGHIVHYQHENIFNEFDEKLKSYEKEMKLLLTKFSGKLKDRESRFIMEFIKKWSNWKDELLADMIALFLLGPAFAYSLYNSFLGRNPFEIFERHPPDNLRTEIIINELSQPYFNFSAISKDLKNKWEKYLKNFEKKDEYNYYVDKKLAELCVNEIKAAFSRLKIEPYDLDKFTKIENSSFKEIKNILDMLNLTWLTFNKTEEKYFEVEEELIKSFIKEA